jgi:hypothetical protein
LAALERRHKTPHAPIPVGCAADAPSFDALIDQDDIAKYHLTARSVVVYLRPLASSKPLVL